MFEAMLQPKSKSTPRATSQAANSFAAAATITLVTIATLGSAHATAETGNIRDPQMKEGQIFVVKMTPASKALEVLITGKKVADLQFSKLGVTASLQIGDQVIQIAPKRTQNRFLLETPANLPGHAGQLKLDVKYENHLEQFEFKLQP